jgi:DNA-binding LacI/PurR family transcriptional regulator
MGWRTVVSPGSAQAARLLIDTLAGKPVHSPKPLRTELIVRGSTGRQT